ncbi:hypothetical protein [Rufibacter tibetensis]|uniref:Lipocalin-like domain-containing protein n=1 Tax=Rufibacter tibetensis TaxID=512763 RepID=A0A0P0CJT0_9BACT|nr:hypothetical protein [Rufibacter tibetensis]ALI99716.1 hypothetical protein DC20_12975 [Rufibacter tibetensis]
MKNKLLILLLMFLSFSCFDKEDAPTMLPEGTYTGIFMRSSPTADYTSANVTLTLEGNSFSGTSDTRKYPAIGKGTYKVEGDEITFDDQSFWTAEFDWSLILDGTFSISTANNQVILTKKRGDMIDVYRLTRQEEKL